MCVKKVILTEFFSYRKLMVHDGYSIHRYVNKSECECETDKKVKSVRHMHSTIIVRLVR